MTLPHTTGDPPRRRGRPGHDLSAVVTGAIEVFTERGFDAATMDDVAAALGIAKSSLYHHVSSKEELLGHAVERGLGALERALDEVDAGPGSALEQLRAAVRSAVITLIDQLDSVTLLLQVRGNSGVERAALNRRRALDMRFAALVSTAQAEQGIAVDLDAHIVARLVFGTINSISTWYRPDTGRNPEAIVDAVVRLLFRGLRPQ